MPSLARSVQKPLNRRSRRVPVASQNLPGLQARRFLLKSRYFSYLKQKAIEVRNGEIRPAWWASLYRVGSYRAAYMIGLPQLDYY